MFSGILCQYESIQTISELTIAYNKLFEVLNTLPNRKQLLKDNSLAYELRLYDLGVPTKRYRLVIADEELIVDRASPTKELKTLYNELYGEYFTSIEVVQGRDE